MMYFIHLFITKLNKQIKRLIGRLFIFLFKHNFPSSKPRTRILPTVKWSIEKGTLRQTSIFYDTHQRDTLIHFLNDFDPDIRHVTITAADTICNHTFDLLGSGPVTLGPVIPWHSDYIHGHTWNPCIFYMDVTLATFPGGYDIKVPWELSRFQYLAWLGQAYWFTNDENYTKKFMDLITDWIHQNPHPLGVNWACTMDVALRAVGWLVGYHYFCGSEMLSDDFLQLFTQSLLIHGRHIRKNLEVRVTRNGIFKANHYLANILGLIYLGISLNGKEADEWRKFSMNAFEEEIINQILPDGVDFEASTSYHRLVCEFFLSAAIINRKNGFSFSTHYYEKLEKMLEFIQAITKPDGCVPLIGDHDNGRAHRLKVWKKPANEWVDYRYLLGIGAILFQREDFARSCQGAWEEAIWLFGNDAVEYINHIDCYSIPEIIIKSSGFSHSGFYVMREREAYMLVDAGRHGFGSSGGHAHNDVLSFECHNGSQTWIVDPGCYGYTLNYSLRNLLRSTVYHNTVAIDGIDQNQILEKNLFSLVDEARPEVHKWHTEDDFDFLWASHSGYQKLAQPITHHRQFYFHKKNPVWWLIRDTLLGSGFHTYEWNFHLPVGLRAILDGNLVLLRNKTEERFGIEVLNQLPFDFSISEGFVSSGYGIINKAPVVKINLKMSAPLVVDFLLSPLHDNDSSLMIKGDDVFQQALKLFDQYAP